MDASGPRWKVMGAVLCLTGSLAASEETPAIAVPVPPTAPAPPPPSPGEEAVIDVTVHGRPRPPSRGTADYQLEVGGLASVPRSSASEVLKLAPGILLTNEGG